MSDPVAFGLSLGYVVAVLGIAEVIRLRWGLPGEFTRKFVHIAIGTWSIPTFHLFTSMWWAAALPLLFVVLNLLSYRLQFFRAIEQEDTSNLGTILFPVSFVILILVFWRADSPAPAMMGLMALAWGDAFAAIIGRRYGRLRYRVLGEERSLEGSFAMYVFSFVAVFAVCQLELAHLPLLRQSMIAVVVAVGCTLLEAVALKGTDNLFIPLGGAAIGWAMLQG